MLAAHLSRVNRPVRYALDAQGNAALALWLRAALQGQHIGQYLNSPGYPEQPGFNRLVEGHHEEFPGLVQSVADMHTRVGKPTPPKFLALLDEYHRRAGLHSAAHPAITPYWTASDASLAGNEQALRSLHSMLRRPQYTAGKEALPRLPLLLHHVMGMPHHAEIVAAHLPHAVESGSLGSLLRVLETMHDADMRKQNASYKQHGTLQYEGAPSMGAAHQLLNYPTGKNYESREAAGRSGEEAMHAHAQALAHILGTRHDRPAEMLPEDYYALQRRGVVIK